MHQHWASKAFVSAMVGACLLSGGPQAEPALAAPLSQAELVAQAWLKADRGFVDRTFNDQDWFSRRRKWSEKYDEREEGVAESMVSFIAQ